MMADFANLNKHFTSVAAFASWLAQQPRPLWPVIGSTYHNTFKPNELTWQGEASMVSMQNHYLAQGWSTGPHVYLAAGTHNPANDGIWLMCPPWQPGIHGLKICNAQRFGLEVVGDFNEQPMRQQHIDLLVDVAAVLHRYADLTQPDIISHRDCAALIGAWRTCPGQAAYQQLPEIRRRLAVALSITSRGVYSEQSTIMGRPAAGQRDVFARFPAPRGHYTERDIYTIILPAYWALALDVGIDPILAIAQMAHETNYLTSFWSQRPQRNPAGIGVNGRWQATPPANKSGWSYNTDAGRKRWEMGISFPTWRHDAVPAHLGRLLAYALPAATVPTSAQQRIISQALSWRALPATMRGSAPILKMLGKVHNPTGQGWASPGDDYGTAIAQTANTLAGF